MIIERVLLFSLNKKIPFPSVNFGPICSLENTTRDLFSRGLTGIDVATVNSPLQNAQLSRVLLNSIAKRMRIVQDDPSGKIWREFGVRTAQTALVYDR